MDLTIDSPITRLSNYPMHLSDVFVDDFLEVVLLGEAHDRFDHLAALEDENRRDPADLELERDVRILIDVKLADGHFARVFARERVDGRTEPLAGTAPFRPEIDQHRRTRFQHAAVEIR